MGRRGTDPHRDVQQPLLQNSDIEAAADQQEDGGSSSSSSVLRLLSEARPEACTIVVGTIFLFIGALSNLAVPKLAGQLVDAVTQAGSGQLSPAAARQLLNQQLYLVLAIMAVGGLASGLRAYLFNTAAERVMCRLRVRLFSKLVLQDVSFFDVTPVGELSNRLAEDTRAIKDAATTSISMALRSTVTVLLGAVMLFVTSWKLALLTCATLPITLASFRVFARLNKRYVASQLTAAAAASATAQEALAGIRTVKSFAKEQHIISKYNSAAQEILSWGLRSAVAGGVFVGTALPLAAGCMMVVFWYGAVLVLQGAMSVGDLNAFMLYAIFVAGSAGGLAGTAAQVITAVGAGRRVFELLDRTPQLPPSGTLRPVGSPQGASLTFKDVFFAYPSRPGSWVLQDFNLTLRPGQTVALVGASGGGKSTVVKLVQRFYDPQQGVVLLDGCDVRQIDTTFLHQQAALVAQEPLVFAESIEYNIRFGAHRSNVSQEEVEAAARAAHAHEFISELPQGYSSRVGEQGVMLSGGQKQRLAIARALLTQPRLLLLDEATSALDAESEHLVQQALQEAARSRSVLVIAHRLSTVTGADVVAVVQQGTVVELGSHSSLLTHQGGVYSQLVQRQVFGAELSHGGSSSGSSSSSSSNVSQGSRQPQPLSEADLRAQDSEAAAAAAAAAIGESSVSPPVSH